MHCEGMLKTERNDFLVLRVASAKCIALCRPFLCDVMSCHLILCYTSSLVPIVLCLVISFHGVYHRHRPSQLPIPHSYLSLFSRGATVPLASTFP